MATKRHKPEEIVTKLRQVRGSLRFAKRGDRYGRYTGVQRRCVGGNRPPT